MPPTVPLFDFGVENPNRSVQAVERFARAEDIWLMPAGHGAGSGIVVVGKIGRDSFLDDFGEGDVGGAHAVIRFHEGSTAMVQLLDSARDKIDENWRIRNDL